MEQAIALVGGIVGILGIASVLVSYGMWRGTLNQRVDGHIEADKTAFGNIDRRLAAASEERAAIRGDVNKVAVAIARLDERSGG